MALVRYGPSLWYEATKRKLSPAMVAHIGFEWISALQLVHSKGMVFVDVSPSNLVLDGKDRYIFVVIPC